MTKKFFTDESLSVLIDKIKNGDADSLANAKSYTDAETIKTKANTKQYVDDLVNDKLSKKPNGADNLITDNDKLSLKYMPDSILGQLVYGGVLYGSGGTDIAGVTGFDAVISLSTNAQNKLALSDSHIGINYADEDFAIYEGLYFICGIGYTFKFGTIDFQVGDWILATADGWQKIDNTDAVQSVAGKTGAVVLSVADINGLRGELDVKVPFTKAAGSTSMVRTFADSYNNVALSLEDTDTTKPKYFFKAFNNESTNTLENLCIQYYQGSTTGVYETVFAVEKNPLYDEMQVLFKPRRDEVLCALNPQYVDNGTIWYYRNGDACALTIYIHVKNCTPEWSDNDAVPNGLHLATLPEGVNTFGAFYGPVVSQADGLPHPGQTYLVKIVGNKIYLATKGYHIDSSWLIGSTFFFKLPN